MNDKMAPSFEEVNSLFANNSPEEVWNKACEVVRLINPKFDFTLVRTVFDDMGAMFHGQFPGYAEVMTPYHDQAHTLHVFLCAVRLAHGVHLSGGRLSDDEIALVMIAALMHDIGYAQTLTDVNGTGAQHTKCHVTRGIEFMKGYLASKGWASPRAEQLEVLIRATDPGFPFAQIPFDGERMRLLAQIVATGDLVGQMADRTYLEKLLFLYLEFKEANFGNYQNVHELLRQTRRFYEITREKLDIVYEGMYTRFSAHFKATMGMEKNYYIESIEKNIAYLDQVTQREETEHLNMLKRGGIAEQAREMPGFKAA